MNFKNMSIKKSLIVGFGTTIIVSAIIIIAALIMMNVQKGSYTDILNEYVAANELVSECRIDYNIAARSLRDAVLGNDNSYLDNATNKANELEAQLEELSEIYPLSDKSELNTFSDYVKSWRTEAASIAQVIRSGDREQAAVLIATNCTPLLEQAATAGDALATRLQSEQTKIIDKQTLTSNIALVIIVVAMVVATIAVVLMAGKIIRSIVEPSNQVRNALVGPALAELLDCEPEAAVDEQHESVVSSASARRPPGT